MRIIETLLKYIRKQKFNFNSIDGISSIPARPFKIPNSGYAYDDIHYILQRKATEFKKSNQLDLAISCLKKSNEISDTCSPPLLSENDYLRLVKYLKLNHQDALALQEEQLIYIKHPDFKDKRISNKKRLTDGIVKCKKFKTDICMLSTPSSCPICGKYNLKKYSISGRSNYEKFPSEFLQTGGTCTTCIWSLNPYF